jgi:hypothetical protein
MSQKRQHSSSGNDGASFSREVKRPAPVMPPEFPDGMLTPELSRRNSLPYDPVSPTYDDWDTNQGTELKVVKAPTEFISNFFKPEPPTVELDPVAARRSPVDQYRTHPSDESLATRTYYESNAPYILVTRNQPIYQDIRNKVRAAYASYGMSRATRKEHLAFEQTVARYAVDAVERSLQEMATRIDTATTVEERRCRRLEYELERAKQQALADKTVHERELKLLDYFKGIRDGDQQKANTDVRFDIGAARSIEMVKNQQRVIEQAHARWTVSGNRVKRLQREVEEARGMVGAALTQRAP